MEKNGGLYLLSEGGIYPRSFLIKSSRKMHFGESVTEKKMRSCSNNNL